MFWTLLSLIVLFLLVITLVRTPYIQNIIVQRVLAHVKEKVKTEVRLEKIYVAFPKRVVLEGLYVEDQNADTLLYSGKIEVDTDLWRLLKNEVTLNSVIINNTVTKLSKAESDSSFNFDFIVDAFISEGEGENQIHDSTSGWAFNIKKVKLSKCRFTLSDSTSGSQINAFTKNTVIELDEFDPSQSIYSVSSVTSAHTRANIKLPGNDESSQPGDSTNEAPAIKVKSVVLDDIILDYRDTRNELFAVVDHFDLDVDGMNLTNQQIEINKLELDNSVVEYRGAASDSSATKQFTESKQLEFGIPWDIKIAEIALNNNMMNFKKGNNSPGSKIDFNNLAISSLNVDANDINVSNNLIKGEIERFSFKESSGFELKSFETNLELSKEKLEVKNFKLITNKSKIYAAADASFDSWNQLMQGDFDLDLKRSILSIEDILHFITLPDSLPVKLTSTDKIALESRLSGKLNNLNIDNLEASAFEATQASINGNIKLLPNSFLAEINIKKFYTTANDINTVLADSIIPQSIRIPDWIDLNGRYAATASSNFVNVQLKSSDGSIKAKGRLNADSTYTAEIQTHDLDAGNILRMPEALGTLEMHSTIQGSGFKPKTIRANVKTTIDKVAVNNYEYKDFNLDGTFDSYLFSGTASLHDDNLNFEIKGKADYADSIPGYQFEFNLVNADFQKLNLSERPLRARGTADINLASSDLRFINGDLSLRNVAIYNGETLYRVDSLLFASIDQEGKSTMTIQSDILSGKFTGTFNIFKTPAILRQHFNRYFSLQNETITTLKEPQHFKFDLTLQNTDLITEILLPDLEPFIPGKISGEFDSESGKLNIDIGVSHLNYDKISSDSLKIDINSDSTELTYRLRLKNIVVDTLQVKAAELRGVVAGDSIGVSFQTFDARNKKKYQVGGTLTSESDNFSFRFSREILLNYHKWEASENNVLRFGSKGLTANKFFISKSNERISLITESKDSTVSLEFENVQLAELTSFVNGAIPASGHLDGNLKFTTAARGTFRSDLKIDSLKVMEVPFGNMTLALSHKLSRYDFMIAIENEQSKVAVNGNYFIKDNKPAFDFTAEFSPLGLQLVEPFSFGQLKNAKGSVDGRLHITGNLDQPVIRGDIHFRDATIKSAYLNNTFQLADEVISFTPSGIDFRNFVIRDHKKNEARITGKILTDDYRDFQLNLRLVSKNFQLLNTAEDDNDLYYGNVRINSDAKITGNSKRPRVTMEISMGEGSKFTYVVPQEQRNVMEQKGIVQFEDKDALNDPFLKNITSLDTTVSSFTGFDLTANIELDDKETLNIIIDPTTGDKLSVQGNSSLALDIDPSGNINLSGRYEIAQGTYELTFYKLVKRKFEIEKGGTITWSGNPLNAQMDITAIYKVETSPIDLVANQLNTTSQSELNMYKNRVPFLVYMNLDGQLLSPQISFKIDMPLEKRSAFGGVVYAKLNDINSRESDVNKQVFALLILKRFVSDNPFESAGGSEVQNVTRASVSRILSDQLNRLSENLKGVQLSFDIKSQEGYNEAGDTQGETQVQLGVSKSLLNDRLVVKLSGNVNVEGETTTQENISDYIGDLSLEYKLTKDGRLRITGFRSGNYDLIDGELTETGVGLIYIKDYNTLRELFKPNDQKK